ncbi:MAG: prolyl oligopeptidase family serine peptidase, partial [Pseudomonadota bacterium]
MQTALNKTVLLLVLLWGIAGSGHATPAIEAFASLPTLTDLEIAPNGRFVAARMVLENRYRVVVLEDKGQQFEVVFVLSEDDEISAKWFHWANEDTLLVSFGFVRQRGPDFETQERRLFSVTMGENELRPLFWKQREERSLQIQDRVVSFLPDDPDHILLQYNRANPREPEVFKVHVSERQRHRRVMASKTTVRSWGADNNGEVRVARGIDGNGRPTLFFRDPGERDWRDFSARVEPEGAVFRPVGFTSDPNVIYVLSNHDVDPAGLYTFNLMTETFGDLIYAHPTVDIASVDVSQQTGEVVSLNFVDDDLETIWFNARPINQSIRALERHFPGKSLTTHGVSLDGGHAVLKVAGGRDAGQFMVFNSVAKRVTMMPLQYTALPAGELGITIPTEYAAADGLIIPAFVTLPPGITSLDAAKNLPFVVNPHGGPTSRDFLRFSFDVQFLASRGYGVLQMNFRGSSGYGTAFKKAGDREWGQAMQDDITD